MKDPLEQFRRCIRGEDFLSVIDKAVVFTDPSLGGWPPFDRMMMFKELIL